MKRSLLGVCTALGLTVAMACGVYALNTGDSLITLSFLTDRFIPEAVEVGADEAKELLDETYDEAVEELDETREELMDLLTGSEGLYSGTLTPKKWNCADVITLETGAGFLMGQGVAQVNHDGVVIDVTQGTEIPSGSELEANHRYLVGEETLADVIVRTGIAQLGVQGSYQLEQGRKGLPFYDLRSEDWFYDAVSFVYEEGIFTGVGGDLFAPELTMNRAMLMTGFYRLAGSPEEEMAAAQASFSDVAADAWYESFVRWAASEEITSGTGPDTFSPELQVTREQVVTLLYSFGTRYLGEKLEGREDITGYTDYELSSQWARDALAWAVHDEILDPRWAGEDTLGAHQYANRAEVSAMLAAFVENIL